MTQPMKLFRVGDRVPREDFVCVPNAVVRGTSGLSFRAIGVLTYLLSHDNSWDSSVSVESMAAEFPEGREAIRTAVKELTDKGYMFVKNVKWTDGNARWVRFITHDPAALAAALDGGKLPFIGSVRLEYDGGKNQVVRVGKPKNPQEPSTGNPQEGSTGNPANASNGKPAEPSSSKKNNNRKKGGEHEAASGLPPLTAFVDMWNLLKSSGYVAAGVKADGETLKTAYERFTQNKTLKPMRDALVDLDLVYERIVAGGPVLRQSWFTLPKLLKGCNADRVPIAEQLMNGAYDDDRQRESTEGAGGGKRGGRHGGAVQPQNSRTRAKDWSKVESEKV